MSNLLNPPDSIDCPDDMIQRVPQNGLGAVPTSGHDPGLDRCREARLRRWMAADRLRTRSWLTIRELSRMVRERRP